VVLQCSNDKDDQNSWIDASETYTLPDDGLIETKILNTKVTQGYRYWRLYIKTSYGSYSSIHTLRFY
jgi:hypothetical protein